MRLWRQLALVMALLAGGPAAVLGWVAVSTVDHEWRQASERRVRRDARQRAEELGTWLADRRDLVREVPASFAFEDLDEQHELALLRLVYRVVVDAELVVMADEDGRAVGPSVPDGASTEEIDALLAGLPLEQALSETEQAHVGTAWAGASGPSVPLAVHLADTGRGPRIIVVQLAVPVVREAADDPRSVGLLRGDGAPILVDGDLVQPRQLTPLLGVFEEFEMDEPEAAHGALAFVPGSPGWTYVLVEPEHALLRLGERITGQILAVAVLATLAGVLAALAMALTVSRPVDRLRRKALQLADGELGVRMGIERSDEIGDLATAFDHLSTRLRADQEHILVQQAEIEAFNAELQSRVEERTRKLEEAQEQLVRTSQLAAVAELGAGLAHDLNNPLTSVLGIAQVLEERYPDDDLVGALEQEAQRCRDVVGAMQRATTLEVDPSRALTTDLEQMVRRAAEWVAPTYAQRGVTLVIERPHSSIEAAIDPDHGTRILAQILQSVRSGLPDGSRVTVSVATERRDGSTGVDDDRPTIRVEADRRVAEQPQHRDDWLTASRVMWVTVQLIDRLGGDLRRPQEGRVWHWVL